MSELEEELSTVIEGAIRQGDKEALVKALLRVQEGTMSCRYMADRILAAQALRSTDPQSVVVKETEAIERVLADEGYDVLESATLAQKIAQALRSTDPQCVVVKELEALRRAYRSAEESAALMRDPARTGGWSGSDRVARSFERIAERVKGAHASLRSEAEVKAEGAREEREKAALESDQFRLGYALACANIVNLHGESDIAADVLREQFNDRQSVYALHDWTDYDRKALRAAFEARLGRFPYRARSQSSEGEV